MRSRSAKGRRLPFFQAEDAKHVAREKIYALILDPKVSFDEMARIMLDSRRDVHDRTEARPLNSMEGPEHGTKEKVVERDLEQMMNSRSVQAFRKHPLLKARVSLSKEKTESNKLCAL